VGARAGNLCSPPDCATTHPLWNPVLGLQNPAPCPPGVTGPCTAPPPFAIIQTFAPFLPLWHYQWRSSAHSIMRSGAGNTGKYNFAGYQITPETSLRFRLDRKISEKNSLWGTFLIDASRKPRRFTGDLATPRFINRQTYTMEDSYAFSPTLVNVFRFGYTGRTSVRRAAQSIEPHRGGHPLGDSARQTTAGLLSAASPLSGGLTLWQMPTSTWNAFRNLMDLFLTKGIHALKFDLRSSGNQLNTAGRRICGRMVHVQQLRENFLTASSFTHREFRRGRSFDPPRQWVWGATCRMIYVYSPSHGERRSAL